MLVNTNAKGRALAKVLGAHPVVLMRGHGDAVVGPSLQVAVFRAIYTEVATGEFADSGHDAGGADHISEPVRGAKVAGNGANLGSLEAASVGAGCTCW